MGDAELAQLQSEFEELRKKVAIARQISRHVPRTP
jgi:hypothetical protein